MSKRNRKKNTGVSSPVDEVVQFGFWERLLFLFTGKVQLEIYIHEGKTESVRVGIGGRYMCYLTENYEQT